jgi:predicted dehydrogenase
LRSIIGGQSRISQDEQHRNLTQTSQTAKHCAKKFHIPTASADIQDVVTSAQVDVVFILTSDEFHEPYIIAALEAGKHVMVEKPLTLSVASAERILAAESKANGPIVFVGYMRRYAASFVETFKREVAGIPRILYARSRDFPGPNAKFVSESGTFVRKSSDFPPGAKEDSEKRLDAFFKECFPDHEITPARAKFCRFMNTLGSHDISLMREVIGSPESVGGVSVNDPFYSAIFNYRNKTGELFAVTYESGWDMVPEFDAHFAVYGEKKRVLIKYDTPFVKGLAIKVTVQEVSEAGEVVSREIIASYEDAYTIELQELYENIVNGKQVKTTARDALEDLKLYDLMYQKYNADQKS